MADFWTLEGMMESTGKKKKKKHDKQKKYEEGEKKKKKKDKDKKDKHNESSKPSNESTSYVPYSEFLKEADEGIYVVKAMVDDLKLETYIIKDDNFEFPRVALNKSRDSYKDWLRKKIETHDSDMNVNKVLYASRVKKINIPDGLLSKIINLSKDDE